MIQNGIQYKQKAHRMTIQLENGFKSNFSLKELFYSNKNLTMMCSFSWVIYIYIYIYSVFDISEIECW